MIKTHELGTTSSRNGKGSDQTSAVTLAGALPSVVLLAGLALLSHHEPVLPEDVGARLEH